MIAVTLAVIGGAAAATTAGVASQPKVTKHHGRCSEAIRAVRFYRAAFTRWQGLMALSGPQDAILWRCSHLRRAARAWQHRAAGARRTWREQFAWWLWLPSKWQRVAICETHLNWHHSNSQFVSAFGISRQTYDGDAAVYGAPPWDDVRNPTPHEQYLAGLGHYHRFNGFSGWGCRGA